MFKIKSNSIGKGFNVFNGNRINDQNYADGNILTLKPLVFQSGTTKQEITLTLSEEKAESGSFKNICFKVLVHGLSKLDEADYKEILKLELSAEDWFYLLMQDNETKDYFENLSEDLQLEAFFGLKKDSFKLKNSTFLSQTPASLLRLREKKKKHKEVKEQPSQNPEDSEGMEYIRKPSFKSWERTVRNKPSEVFMPKTIKGLRNLVNWAKESEKRVRASGYQHTSSEMYSENEQVLVSMLDFETAIKLPASYPQMNPKNELQRIELMGESYLQNGEYKIKCKIGASTCNYHFQDWVHDEQQGKGQWKWTLPLNVIMTEITFGGSNAPICHGGGISNKTLSDLVTEIEFVNAKGEIQTVNNTEQLKAASGCFGLLGIVTSITLQLDEMSFANLKTVEKKLLTLTIPHPQYKVPENIKRQLDEENKNVSEDDMRKGFNEFKSQCEDSYYSEWFWFPLQQKAWVNCWQNVKDIKREKVKRYPGDGGIARDRRLSYLAHLANETFLRFVPGKTHAQIIGGAAMTLMPDFKNNNKISEKYCSLEDAIHFRHGIQNIRTKMLEIEIPVPNDDRGDADWSICQKAWWSVIESVYAENNREHFPMRTTLEMRIMGGSGVLMAPQFKNERTCAIEILTPTIVDEKYWGPFLQEVLDKWSALTDVKGNYLNIRPHWAKRFNNLFINRKYDAHKWANYGLEDVEERLKPYESAQRVSIPMENYLRELAYANQIPEFKKQLETICEAGGYSIKELQDRFSNSFLDKLLFETNNELALQVTPRRARA